MSVSTTRAATALTRIPRGPRMDGEMLHQGVEAPLLPHSGFVPTTARAASDERKTMLLPFDRIGRAAAQEERCADVDWKSLSKSSTSFPRWSPLSNPCIGDKVSSDLRNAAGLPGKLAGAVRGGKIRRYGIRSTTVLVSLHKHPRLPSPRPYATRTWAPGRQRARVAGAPMPRDAPVTSAVLPIREP